MQLNSADVPVRMSAKFLNEKLANYEEIAVTVLLVGNMAIEHFNSCVRFAYKSALTRNEALDTLHDNDESIKNGDISDDGDWIDYSPGATGNNSHDVTMASADARTPPVIVTSL